MRCQAHNHAFTWLKTLSHPLRYTTRPAKERKKDKLKTSYSSTNASGPKSKASVVNSMECQTFHSLLRTVFFCPAWQAGRRGPCCLCCQVEKQPSGPPLHIFISVRLEHHTFSPKIQLYGHDLIH